MHHASTILEQPDSNDVVQKVRLYGHGGSHHKPTDIAKRLGKDGSGEEVFDWADFHGQDAERVAKILEKTRPDMVLSHSPSRPYVNTVIEQEEFNYQKELIEKELIYLGGHTHVQQYYQVVSEDGTRKVHIVRPGALGLTYHRETNPDGSPQPLPQTFMVIDPTDMETCKLYTLKKGKFKGKKLKEEHKTLEQYNDEAGRWEPQH